MVVGLESKRPGKKSLQTTVNRWNIDPRGKADRSKDHQERRSSKVVDFQKKGQEA